MNLLVERRAAAAVVVVVVAANAIYDGQQAAADHSPQFNMLLII
jgi:hypothetical protein